MFYFVFFSSKQHVLSRTRWAHTKPDHDRHRRDTRWEDTSSILSSPEALRVSTPEAGADIPAGPEGSIVLIHEQMCRHAPRATVPSPQGADTGRHFRKRLLSAEGRDVPRTMGSTLQGRGSRQGNGSHACERLPTEGRCDLTGVGTSQGEHDTPGSGYFRVFSVAPATGGPEAAAAAGGVLGFSLTGPHAAPGPGPSPQ